MPKHKWVKQANESNVQPGETGVEHGVRLFLLGYEDNAADIEGADSPSTSSHAEDKTTTSFLFTYLPYFIENFNHRALDVALRFRSMSRTNDTAENAIAMVDAVIAFLSGVEEEEEDMVTSTTTHSDGATTSTAATMTPRTSVKHALEVRE
ncbi:hypothetical protein Syun_029130 [Stephania yunnanensis]|uniref:Uncharacterized protein n=1 Tax=Stephania yunnanensis TaxID=152371 RepID=A0AAP0E529_9MAGN